MAYATYRGSRVELSLSLPIPKDGVEVHPWPHRWDTGQTSHNESVMLPPGVRRRIHRWAALWLAGARRRWGPWVEVRLEPGEWQACRQEAPWLRKARHACLLTQPEHLERFLAQEVHPPERWAITDP